MATKHPDTKLDLITPKKVDVDMKLIERPSITSSAQDAKQKLIFATINGQRVQAPINKQQWQKMWLAEDMGAYKRALAAVIFEPMLKKGMEGEQSQQAVSESEKVEIKEKPAPENKVQETVTETHRTGLHM
jgi:DNA primase